MSSPTTPPTPDSQSNPQQPPPEQPRVVAPPLRMKGSRQESPSGSPIPSATTNPDGADVGGFVPDPIDATTSIPSRDEQPERVVKVDRSAVAEIVRGLVASAALFLHRHLTAADDLETEAGLWIATERDQKQIADPVAAIAARHGVPIGNGGQDTADLIAMGIGIAGYIVRNARSSIAVKVARRRAEKSGARPFEAPEPKRDDQQ